MSKEKKADGNDNKAAGIGCAIVLVIAFFIIAGCNAIFGNDEDKKAEEKPTVTQSAPAEPAITDKQVEDWAKSVVGGKPADSWNELATAGKAPSWAYAVNRVYYGKGGNIVFNVQLDRKADKSIAEQIGKLYANSLKVDTPKWAESVSWIVVEDGTGTHIDQTHVN